MSAKPSGFVGIAERLGHRLGHRDHERREHERLGAGSVIGASPLSMRRWLTTAPHALAAGDQITGCGPLVSGFGPSGGQQRRARARRLPRRAHEHARVADLRLVRAVELLRELGHHGDLLGRRRHVDDDAVARIGVREVVAPRRPRRWPTSTPPRDQRETERERNETLHVRSFHRLRSASIAPGERQAGAGRQATRWRRRPRRHRGRALAIRSAASASSPASPLTIFTSRSPPSAPATDATTTSAVAMGAG